MKFIEKHIKLRSIVKKWGLIKKLKQKIFLLTDKNWNVRKKISRISVDWRWPRNSTKQLYWLFTKKIIAQTTSPTSLSRLTFYPRLTVIYILVFLPSVVYRFIKKTHSFIKINWTFIFLKNISLIIVSFPGAKL